MRKGCARKHLLFRCAVVAFVAGALLAGCTGRRSEQHRQQGDSYLYLHKYAEAEAAYRSAIQTNPANIQAQLGLGRCLAASGKPEEALAFFQEMIKNLPANDLGYLEAANLLLKLGNTDEAMATARSLEANDPEHGGVLHGSLMLRVGQTSEAVTLLAALRDRFPDSALVRMHLACALLAAKQPEKAETELKTVLEKQPEGSTGADMLMVEAMQAQGKISEVIERQEKLKAESLAQTMILARALTCGNRAEEGESLVRDAMGINPSYGWTCFVLGAHLLAKGQRSEAASYLQTAAMTLPWEAVVMRDLAEAQKASLPSSPHPKQAQTAPPEKKKESAPPNATAASPTPAATATTAQEDWLPLWRQAALRQLLEKRASFTGKEGDHLAETLVLTAFFCSNTALAEELAKQLPADSPLNAYLQSMRERDVQKAIKALEPWESQGNDLKLLAQDAVGYALGISGARGQAVQVLSACWDHYPDNGVSMLILAQVFRSAQMPKFAIRAVEKLTAAFPENIEAHRLLFGVLREAGMQREARQAAETMYAIFPDSLEANQAVSGIYMDCKEFDRAEKIADHYLHAHPGDPEMQLTQASILLHKGQAADALKILAAIPAADSTAANVAVLTALANAIAQDWQKVAAMPLPDESHPMALSARFMLAAAFVKTGQKDKAVSVLTQPEKDKPFGGRAGAVLLKALGQPSATTLSDDENALANQLASSAESLVDFAAGSAYQLAQLHDDAYLAFKRIDDAFPGDNDCLLDLLFRSLPNTARIQGVQDEAKALAQKHAARPKAWLEYAAVLQRLGDTAGEREALDKAAKAGPDVPEVLLRRGDFLARQKDMDGAIAEYHHLLTVRPDDAIANNNLAYYLLTTGGDVNEALKAAQLAFKALPRDAHVLHTLGAAQLRAGDLEQSKKNLTSALQLMPGDPSLLLDYGKLLIAFGNPAEGRRQIESALDYSKALGVDFDRKSEAEDVLAKTPAPTPQTKPPDPKATKK